MIKLLLGRLLPIGLTVGLMTSALSPLRPALKAFGVAANALAGDSDAGGADGLGAGLGSGVVPGMGGANDDSAVQHEDSRRKLLDLADSLRGDAPKLKTYNAGPVLPPPARPKQKRKRSPRAPLHRIVRPMPVQPRALNAGSVRPLRPWIGAIGSHSTCRSGLPTANVFEAAPLDLWERLSSRD